MSLSSLEVGGGCGCGFVFGSGNREGWWWKSWRLVVEIVEVGGRCGFEIGEGLLWRFWGENEERD